MTRPAHRPRKHDVRLLPNGLTPDLNDWYKAQGAKYRISGTELRRRVLMAFRDGTSWNDLNRLLIIECNERTWKPKEAQSEGA